MISSQICLLVVHDYYYCSFSAAEAFAAAAAAAVLPFSRSRVGGAKAVLYVSSSLLTSLPLPASISALFA